MSNKSYLKKERGTSLVELMISIAVGSILLLTALYVLRDFFKTQKTAQRLTQLQSASEKILNDLTQEIHWSKSFSWDVDLYQLTLYQEGDVEVTFRLQDEILNKDGQPIHPDNIKVTKFSITNRAPAGEVGCLEIALGLEHAGRELPITTMEKQTTISIRKSTLSLASPSVTATGIALGVIYDPDTDEIEATWVRNDPSEPEPDGYKLVWATHKDPTYPATWAEGGAQWISSDKIDFSSTASDLGLTPGKKYYFRVCYYIGGVCDYYSNEVSLTV